MGPLNTPARTALFIGVWVALAGPGSATATAGDASAAAAPVPAASAPLHVEGPHYTIGAGDILRVRVYEEPRLSGSYTVSQDGRIDLPWIGKVNVTGLGVDQIAELVETRYAEGYLVSPQVVVDIETFGSKPVQILGNIQKPGTYYLRGQTDLIGLLAQAGGIADQDQLSTYEVQIKRARGDGVEPIAVSVDRLMHLGEGNVRIEAGDLVHITRGRVVFVSGEVTKPGAVAWREGLTVSAVVAAAGGAAQTANLRKVLILRGDERLTVSVRDIQRGRAPDVPIRADDQIIVDESAF